MKLLEEIDPIFLQLDEFKLTKKLFALFIFVQSSEVYVSFDDSS